MKHIFITGGAGFIGSELGKYLLTKDFKVTLLDNLEYGYRDNFEDNKILSENFIHDDIRSENFDKYLSDVDTVIHFAGISALPECESNPSKAFDVNTTGVANVLAACRKAGVKRFIFASTSATYENNPPESIMKESDVVIPNLVYSTSKLCGEKICQSFADNYDMDIIICRFFNVFGPHQDFKRKYPPFTSYLIREILANRIPTIYNLSDVARDYIYVEDLMEYLYRMIISNKKYSADIFNLATGQGYSTLEITQTIYEALDKKIQYEQGNPINFWDKYEDLFNQKYNLSKERVKKEVFKSCIGDNSKIIQEFNYVPKTDLKTGVKNIIEYQKQYNG